MRVEAVSVITSACVALWLAVGCLPLLTPAQAQAFSHSRIHADEEPPLPDVVALIGQRRSEITAVFPGRDRMFFSWRRWDRLHLVFSRDGQFVGVRLYRNAGITEQQPLQGKQGVPVSIRAVLQIGRASCRERGQVSAVQVAE